jgi:hypothetical protein
MTTARMNNEYESACYDEAYRAGMQCSAAGLAYEVSGLVLADEWSAATGLDNSAADAQYNAELTAELFAGAWGKLFAA